MNFKKIFNTRLSNIQGHKIRPENALNSLENIVQDKAVFEKLKRQGYAVVTFLNEEELQPLQKNLNVFMELSAYDSSTLFYTSGRDKEEIRIKGKELSWPLVEKYLHRIIQIENSEMEGCAWLLKPPGDAGVLSPHQDSSLIDETRFSSIYGWMPLDDVDSFNGTIQVIPKSHLWGIHFRSLDVDWPLRDCQNILSNYCIPVDLKAGEILLFEGALIHGSGINQSTKTRAAINFFFKPKEVDYLHFVSDERSPKNKVEAYRIDMDFFYKHDFRKRPNTDVFPFFQFYDFDSTPWTEKKLQSVIQQCK